MRRAQQSRRYVGSCAGSPRPSRLAARRATLVSCWPGSSAITVGEDRPLAAPPSDRAPVSDAEPDETLGDSVGVGLQAFPEQGVHLVPGDLGTFWDRPQFGDHRIRGITA